MVLSHVKFKKWPCRMSVGSMSHVEFKKWPCCPVDFRGLGPQSKMEQHFYHYKGITSSLKVSKCTLLDKEYVSVTIYSEANDSDLKQ